MLCQKCGLQGATVHLETTVFRQKIEEHLCLLCAGARAGETKWKDARRSGSPQELTSRSGAQFADQTITSAIHRKVLQLLRLSKQQGYLTFEDVQAALPESLGSKAEIDFILSALRVLEIEILPPDQIGNRSVPSFDAEPTSSDVLDPVQEYLKQMENVRRLTHAQAVALFKRIERAETAGKTCLFTAPAIGRYLEYLGAKLLRKDERLERLVSRSQLKNPGLYLERLPGLLASLRRREAVARRAWEKHCDSPTAAKKKVTRKKSQVSESALRAYFPRFGFRLEVYEDYLTQLQPLLDEISELRTFISVLPKTKNPGPAQEGLAMIRARLRSIERHQRITPARLLAIARKTSLQLKAVERAKNTLIEAHLRDVIAIAQEHVNRGLSFLDLVLEGNLGLMNAVENFDYREGKKFAAFAPHWIRLKISRALPRDSGR